MRPEPDEFKRVLALVHDPHFRDLRLAARGYGAKAG